MEKFVSNYEHKRISTDDVMLAMDKAEEEKQLTDNKTTRSLWLENHQAGFLGAGRYSWSRLLAMVMVVFLKVPTLGSNTPLQLAESPGYKLIEQVVQKVKDFS